MALSPDTNPTDVGQNRTGVQRSPRMTAEMADCTQAVASHYDPLALAPERAELGEKAPPVGTMPPPATLKGVASTAVQALKGEKATVLLDKLGERLAFERTGVRLYEAVMAKVPAADTGQGSLTLGELRRIHDEELAHFLMLRECMEKLGADPTAVTPCADVAGVQGMGLIQVLGDPRTTLTQALDAILTAELVDNDGWTTLIALAEASGQNELAERFTDALAEEDEHLATVRLWIRERLGVQLGASLPATPPPA